ncbi:hypothetical protein B0H19DRAFT_429387 [Mycena capillaripes]|nr:hypothetical protein B0H19DRAFT_429387 [Mycena capillaripes]
MAIDNRSKGQIFEGIKYHISPHLPGPQKAQLRSILNSNGAHEIGAKSATRIITDQAHFSEFQKPQCTAALVTPQWAFASNKSGVKQLSRHYSADSAMFFSSLVISVLGITPPHADLIQAIITKYGGQWAATLTEDVTHLIADTVLDSVPLPAFNNAVVVSHKWIRDSFERESRQDIAPYVLLERNDAHSASQMSRPVGLSKAKPTALIPDQRQLPFLPLEIIMKIHLICRDLALDEFKSFPYIHALLRISQVCQRWRAIAHCNGPLWTSIFLDFHSTKAYKRLSKLAEVGWIARSGSYPLSVKIRSYFPNAPNPAIDFLLAHASRIRDLSLQLPTPQFYRFLRLKPGSFPCLEKITLRAIPRCNWDVDPAMLGMTRAELFADELPYTESDPGILWGGLCAPSSVFKNMPKLREVKIDAHCDGFDPHLLGLPWASLTDIEIQSVDIGVDDTAHLLKLIVNAHRLSFCTGLSQGPVMPLIRAVRLPINRLSWHGYLVDDVSIFAPLILPNLISLDMRDVSDETLRILREHAPFKLEELHLVFSKLSFPATAVFLRDMHAMTTLKLTASIALTDELMEFLTYDARAPVLPALKILALDDRQKYFHERAMLLMVESRWLGNKAAPHLQQVTIGVSQPRCNPGNVFDSCAVVPPGLAIVPVPPTSILRGILDRIAEMNEEGLAFTYKIGG